MVVNVSGVFVDPDWKFIKTRGETKVGFTRLGGGFVKGKFLFVAFGQNPRDGGVPSMILEQVAVDSVSLICAAAARLRVLFDLTQKEPKSSRLMPFPEASPSEAEETLMLLRLWWHWQPDSSATQALLAVCEFEAKKHRFNCLHVPDQPVLQGSLQRPAGHCYRTEKPKADAAAFSAIRF